MDDEIAMATLLERTADWVRGEGPEPYPLAEGAAGAGRALAGSYFGEFLKVLGSEIFAPPPP
jgi:hypothetical protein